MLINIIYIIMFLYKIKYLYVQFCLYNKYFFKLFFIKFVLFIYCYNIVQLIVINLYYCITASISK